MLFDSWMKASRKHQDLSSIAQRLHFQHLGDLSDLENAISNMERAVSLTDDSHPNKPMFLSNLGVTQRNRFEHLGEMTNFLACVSSFKAAAQSTAADCRTSPACCLCCPTMGGDITSQWDIICLHEQNAVVRSV
jgi:hypothetical protein